jgi:hypothetical protein
MAKRSDWLSSALQFVISLFHTWILILRVVLLSPHVSCVFDWSVHIMVVVMARLRMLMLFYNHLFTELKPWGRLRNLLILLFRRGFSFISQRLSHLVKRVARLSFLMLECRQIFLIGGLSGVWVLFVQMYVWIWDIKPWVVLQERIIYSLEVSCTAVVMRIVTAVLIYVVQTLPTEIKWVLVLVLEVLIFK